MQFITAFIFSAFINGLLSQTSESEWIRGSAMIWASNAIVTWENPYLGTANCSIVPKALKDNVNTDKNQTGLGTWLNE